MKPFRFRLQSVFDLRGRALDEAKQAYALAVQAVEAALRELQDAAAELDRLERRIAESRTRTFLAHEHDTQWSGLRVQSAECDRLAGCLRQARYDAELRRQEMIEARMAHETLVGLRTRQQQDHAAASRRREDAELDELATAAFARRQPAFHS